MKNSRLAQRICALFVGCMACSLFADDITSPLEISVTAHVLEAAKGPMKSKEWLPATTLKEGEQVFYTVRIRNLGSQSLAHAIVTRPLPRYTKFVVGSASAPGADILFSADGGQTFARPEQLMITDGFGKMHRASAADYTHIQWQLLYPLAPGAVALARFSVTFGKS